MRYLITCPAAEGDFAQDIAAAAEDAVAACEYVTSKRMDYSEASLVAVQETLAGAVGWDAELTPEQIRNFVRSFECYVLEVARREFGGRYCWFDQRDSPVLVAGEPAFRVALLARDQVQGRLAGDAGCDIPFLYSGFAERVRRAKPGTDALFV